MSNGIRVLIGIASGDKWWPDFGLCMTNLAATFRSGEAFCGSRRSCYPSVNRHNFVKDAIEAQCSHLAMFDPDHTFPPFILDRFLAHSVPVVGCVYPRRKEGAPMVGTPLEGTSLWTDGHGLRPMRMLGTGLILIRMDVFEGWKPPYFKMQVDEMREEEDGEDAVFCARAFERDIAMFADLDLSREVTHIGERHFTLRDAGKPQHREGWKDDAPIPA